MWADGDTSEYRIHQQLDARVPFKVLFAKKLPIGDFDGEAPGKPNCPHRLYKTAKGWRILYIGLYDNDFLKTLQWLEACGSDPRYISFCQRRGQYHARLEPKIKSNGSPWAVTRFISQEGEPLPQWEECIGTHDHWTRAQSNLPLI